MLKNKRIIITGASSGIGSALAKGLATLGGKIGLFSRSRERLNEIVREIEMNGGQALFRTGDVQRAVQVQQGLYSLVEELGGIDVLINNAGVMELDTIPKNYAEIDRIIDTNLKGPLYCTLAVMPFLFAQKSGAIINTSSVLSLEQVASYMSFSAVYAMSKAGINMMTRVLAQRLSSDSIQINAILPGFIDTKLIQGVPEKVLQQFGVMQPEELLPYYAFFAANNDRLMTGRLIPVEIFNSACKFIKKEFGNRVPSWAELESPLKKRYADPKYNVYGDALQLFTDNRKLLLSIGSWNLPENLPNIRRRV